MTTDCSVLSEALTSLSAMIGCRAADDGRTLIVTTGHYYSDGDPVELFARPSDDGERIVISDGGISRARLDLSGIRALSPRARKLWNDILDEFGASEMADRVYTRTSLDHAASGISLMADTCLSLDSVQLLTAGERRTFADDVREWLATDAGLNVKGTHVLDRFGDSQTVTAIVESSRGDVVVHAAGGNKLPELRSSAEHAFFVFSGLAPKSYPMKNRLVILQPSSRKGGAADRLRRLVRRVTEVSYAGMFDRQLALSRFLVDRDPPPVRDLVFETYGQDPLSPF